jgi:hypothetical protein
VVVAVGAAVEAVEAPIDGAEEDVADIIVVTTSCGSAVDVEELDVLCTRGRGSGVDVLGRGTGVEDVLGSGARVDDPEFGKDTGVDVLDAGVEELDVIASAAVAVRVICSSAVAAALLPLGERNAIKRYLSIRTCVGSRGLGELNVSKESDWLAMRACTHRVQKNLFFRSHEQRSLLSFPRRWICIQARGAVCSLSPLSPTPFAMCREGTAVTHSTPETMSPGETANEAVKSDGGAGQVVLAVKREETRTACVSVLLRRITSSAPFWARSVST